MHPWIHSKDVVLAVQYKVYLVKRVISLVNTVQYSLGQLLTYMTPGQGVKARTLGRQN